MRPIADELMVMQGESTADMWEAAAKEGLGAQLVKAVYEDYDCYDGVGEMAFITFMNKNQQTK